MLSWLLPILKSSFAVLGAVLVVVFVIVFGGPRIFGPESRMWCYIIGAAVLVGFLIYLFIKKRREKKNARLLEGFLNQQADDQLMSAKPDVKDELAAIREKLNRAMQILKSSRLARGRRGGDALYVLPWYMIIGPSSCGKSTAIRNSGLHFPPVDPDSEDPGRVKGLGGTRNCDWWFSNEGIILDTAGRYTISASAQEDREEWSNFLQMLKKARARAPINGLILAISADELLQKDADGLEAHAKALRSRIDELILKLEILFPVYIVFTKCDLISGFVESFGDLSKVDREQVWGYTRAYGPAREPLQKEYDREIDGLDEMLKRRRLKQLAVELRPAQKSGMYMFPVEFAAAQSKLSAFIETLARPNPYQQNPLIRGVYFTSGTQEGTPIAQVMAQMQREFALASGQVLAAEPVGETKAYFIRDLFQEIILPDEAKVFPTTRAWRRQRFLRLAAIAGQLIATVALSVLLLLSFVNNRRHNGHLRDTAERIIRTTGGVYAFNLDMLDSLDVLRERLEARESSVPLMSRWGLYSGGIVDGAVREAYFKRYHDLLLAPTAAQLTTVLSNTINCDDTIQFAQQYGAFTAYQILTFPRDSVPNLPSRLRTEVLAAWRPYVSEDRQMDLEFLTEKQVGYYWKHRAESEMAWLQVPPSRQLIATVNAQIGLCWTPRRLYQATIDQLNAELGSAYTYLDASSTTTRLDGGSIGRAFTRVGWEDRVRDAIREMPRTIASDPVLMEAFANFTDEDIRRQFVDFYVSDFIAGWRGFIASGRVLPFHDLTDAFAGTDELSQDPSPIVRILESVFAQSEILNLEGDRFEKIETEFTTLGWFLGRRNTQPGDETGKDKYLSLLSALPSAVQGIEQQLTSEARCAQSLQRFYGDLNLKQQQVERLMRGSGLSGACAGLLTQPLEASQRAASAGACACLDREWKAKVWDQYEQELATSYPFNPAGSAEASPGQVEDFFTRTLKSFDRDEIEPASELGIGVSDNFRRAMRAAREIQKILARGGTDKIRFTLTAEAGGMTGIRRMQFGYSREPMWEYVMGHTQTREYKWPSAGGADCDLRVDARTDGIYYQPMRFTGGWGIFRMFDGARRDGQQLVWEFKSADGQVAVVRLALGGSDAAFIQAGHLTQFHCPEAVCR